MSESVHKLNRPYVSISKRIGNIKEVKLRLCSSPTNQKALLDRKWEVALTLMAILQDVEYLSLLATFRRVVREF